MTKLVETVARALVDNPDMVSVTDVSDAGGECLRLTVAENDMGKVIGKRGRIAKAIRTVVKSASARQNRDVYVEIVSAGGEGLNGYRDTVTEESSEETSDINI